MNGRRHIFTPSKALLDAFNFVYIDFKTGIPYDGRKLKNRPVKNTERFGQNSRWGSRDTKHFKINCALCEALETILLIWGQKLRWLSYETPRSVTEETVGRIEL